MRARSDLDELTEWGLLPQLDEQTALWLVAKDVMQHIAVGDIGAYEGASRIWRNV